MSTAQTTEVFNCSPDQFFDVITDFERYPDFLKEVSRCQVVEDRGEEKIVEYHIDLIKQFSYRLHMYLDRPHKLEWELDSGDLFKVSNGYWKLKEVDGEKTEATYFVEAKFKVFVPGPVAKTLINVNLPNMMSAYPKRVEELYG